ncbi:Di-copper centre-containing protein, partial [Ramicandelaber brevisporus]
MTTTERTKYFNAVKLLNTGTRPNQFDRFAQVHVYFAGQIHGYAPFFPFHRQFLRDWEQTLQRVANDNTIYQPFWDWALDASNPQGSPIFTSNWLSGNSNGGCASIPSLGGQWQVLWNGNYQQQLRCLVRNFNQAAMNAYYSQSALQTIFSNSGNFGAFSPAIEGGPHGNVHVSIGGSNGDMGNMASPNDPFFWFHHAFIDKLWNDWMNQNIGARQWDYSG